MALFSVLTLLKELLASSQACNTAHCAILCTYPFGIGTAKPDSPASHENSWRLRSRVTPLIVLALWKSADRA